MPSLSPSIPQVLCYAQIMSVSREEIAGELCNVWGRCQESTQLCPDFSEIQLLSCMWGNQWGDNFFGLCQLSWPVRQWSNLKPLELWMLQTVVCAEQVEEFWATALAHEALLRGQYGSSNIRSVEATREFWEAEETQLLTEAPLDQSLWTVPSYRLQ